MVVIPFLVTHERNADGTKKMEDLVEELRPEFPGIIRLLAEYYIKLKNELRGNIPISKESELYKLGYIAEVESDVDRFIDNCIVFDPQALAATRSIYNAYMDYYDFDPDAAKRGEALSMTKFSKFIFNKYKDQVHADTQRVNGKPARCFRGMILKSPEEIMQSSPAVSRGNSAGDLWNGVKTGEPEEDPF
jgi:CRISPR/Cas system CMR-associated protein Cmr3 (group 5 of RAMP superfamily)